ncbi:MAG: hypothetical protein RMJ33_03215 [Saprospiraceae bacterium]|nr:hypothetical protein [Saprospiraceae bacterium]MDW8228827.1 hypothetical protein [Saprospiraceae bacterium]
MANKTSQHILNTAANLLGFCLFVITSLHITSKSQSHLVDEFTSVVAMLLTVSSVLSFMSIRTQSERLEYRLELLADYFFLLSLLGILGVIVYMFAYFWET